MDVTVPGLMDATVPGLKDVTVPGPMLVLAGHVGSAAHVVAC